MPSASDPECRLSTNSHLHLTDHCRHHDHFDLDILDEEFEIPVDQMFQLLFTDSPVFRELHRRRHTYDMVQSPWPQEADPDGTKVRSIYYTLSINYSVGPKSSPSTERQIIHAESKPGTSYLVDAECFNSGVPYAESFYSVVRYCFTRTAVPDRCRLIISGKVCWRKPTWGLFKKFLDNVARTGMISSFSVMGELLRAEAIRAQTGGPSIESQEDFPKEHSNPIPHPEEDHDTRPRRQVRRKRKSTSGPRIDLHSPKGTKGTSTLVERDKNNNNEVVQQTQQSLTIDFHAVLIFITILALLIVNLVLFYQVKSLETIVARTTPRARTL